MATAKTSPAKKPTAKSSPAKKAPAVKKPDPVAAEIKELLAVQAGATASAPVVADKESQPEVVDQEPVQEEAVELVKDLFMIAKKDCVKCVHLCPETGSIAPTNCHYDNGNEDCPARTVTIMIGMSIREVESAATAIVEATENGDFPRLTRAANRLAGKSESVRAAVSKRVLELQEEHRTAQVQTAE